MHARQSVTSVRETEPAGNSEKSNTSRACFAFEDFELLEAAAFVAAFDAFGATDFLLAAVFFDADFFGAFDAADFLPAAFFTFDAAIFFAAFLTAGFAFFAAVFELFLVEAI